MRRRSGASEYPPDMAGSLPLVAAAARPRITFFGDDAYPTFEDKVAALLHSLVRNHAPWMGTSAWHGRQPVSSAWSTAGT